MLASSCASTGSVSSDEFADLKADVEKILKSNFLTTGPQNNIFEKGSISNLFYYEDTLHGVGLRDRFDWPTNPTILKFSKPEHASFKFKLFDRNISKAKINNSILYFFCLIRLEPIDLNKSWCLPN